MERDDSSDSSSLTSAPLNRSESALVGMTEFVEGVAQAGTRASQPHGVGGVPEFPVLVQNLFSMIGHELRTPIHLVDQALSGLNGVFPADSAESELVAIAKRASDRLHALVDSVLSVEELAASRTNRWLAVQPVQVAWGSSLYLRQNGPSAAAPGVLMLWAPRLVERALGIFESQLLRWSRSTPEIIWDPESLRLLYRFAVNETMRSTVEETLRREISGGVESGTERGSVLQSRFERILQDAIAKPSAVFLASADMGLGFEMDIVRELLRRGQLDLQVSTLSGRGQELVFEIILRPAAIESGDGFWRMGHEWVPERIRQATNVQLLIEPEKRQELALGLPRPKQEQLFFQWLAGLSRGALYPLGTELLWSRQESTWVLLWRSPVDCLDRLEQELMSDSFLASL